MQNTLSDLSVQGSNTQQFYNLSNDSNYRFVSNDIPVSTKSHRDHSPTQMSRTHARELLTSLNDYVNNTKNLDDKSKEILTDKTSDHI